MGGRIGTLKNDIAKAAVLLISLIIGLLCGGTTDAFYIAVLVQSLSNAYDSFGYIGVPSKLVTGAYVFALFAAVLSLICAVLHFSPTTTSFTNQVWVITVICAFLSIPFVIVVINIVATIRSGEF